MLRPITAQSTDRICCLILGPAGIGKTSQIRCLLGQEWKDGQWMDSGLAPEKPLVLSAESGLLSCRDLVAAGKVEGFEIRSIGEFREALQYCQSQAFKEAGYKWIFIDSLTEIAARCAEDLQSKYPSKTDSFKMWAEYTSTMTDIIKTFRDLPDVSVAFSTVTPGYDQENIDIAASNATLALSALVTCMNEFIRSEPGLSATVSFTDFGFTRAALED